MVARWMWGGALAICCLLLGVDAVSRTGYGWATTDRPPVGVWTDTDHWSPKGTVPGSVDSANTSVSIQAPTGPPQLITEPSRVTLECCMGAAINSLSIGPRSPFLPAVPSSENSLTIGVGGQLAFVGNEANPIPLITNHGVITVLGWMHSNVSDPSPTTIEGVGKVVLLDNGEISGSLQNSQLIEGEGIVRGVMYNEGTIRAAGRTLRIYATTYNAGGIVTTDGYSDAYATSTVLIGAAVSNGTIDANGGRVRFVTSATLTGATLTGALHVIEFPGLNLAGAVTVGPDGVVSSSAVGVQGSGSVEMKLLDQATLVNNGEIRLESPTSPNYLIVHDKAINVGSNATLAGTGRLVLKGSQNWVSVDSASSLIHDAGHTIEGAGRVGGAYLMNRGTITAKDGTLVVTAGMWNNGTLAASSTGILELAGGANLLRNAGDPGVILPNGGTIRLTGAKVVNGEWGDGKVDIYYLTSPTPSPSAFLSGNNHFSAGTTVEFVTSANGSYSATAAIPGSHTVTNDGTIRMTGYSKLYSGIQNGTGPTTATLSGSGTLLLVPGASPQARLMTYGQGTFVNDAAHTIRGAGVIEAAIENRGALIAENGYLSVLQPMTGQGTIQVKDTGKLYLAANVQGGQLWMDPGAVLDHNYNTVTITLSGNFGFAQTDEAKWYRGKPRLRMNGGARTQRLEVGSQNLGVTWTDFDGNNFQLQALSVEGGGTRVALDDTIDNGNGYPSEALYARALTVAPGATLNLNGRLLYTRLNNTPRRVVAGEGSLFGGGDIIDVPEDGAPPPTFTDDPLQAGGTAVKLVHLTELREAVDSLRARHSLPVFSWTDSAPTTGTSIVRAVHVLELRAALAEVYGAAGKTPPAYTDAPLDAMSTPIKAVHVSEIRAAILGVW